MTLSTKTYIIVRIINVELEEDLETAVRTLQEAKDDALATVSYEY